MYVYIASGSRIVLNITARLPWLRRSLMPCSTHKPISHCCCMQGSLHQLPTQLETVCAMRLFVLSDCPSCRGKSKGRPLRAGSCKALHNPGACNLRTQLCTDVPSTARAVLPYDASAPPHQIRVQSSDPGAHQASYTAYQREPAAGLARAIRSATFSRDFRAPSAGS